MRTLRSISAPGAQVPGSSDLVVRETLPDLIDAAECPERFGGNFLRRKELVDDRLEFLQYTRNLPMFIPQDLNRAKPHG